MLWIRNCLDKKKITGVYWEFLFFFFFKFLFIWFTFLSFYYPTNQSSFSGFSVLLQLDNKEVVLELNHPNQVRFNASNSNKNNK